MKAVYFSCFLLIELLTGMVAAHAQQSPSEQLYPWRSGKMFGGATLSGKMVIPAVFASFKSGENYYIATDNSGLQIVFNNKGVAIDTANTIHELVNGSLLLLNPYPASGNEQMHTIELHKKKQWNDWALYSVSKGAVRDNAGNSFAIKDTVVAVNKTHQWLWLKNREEQAIYDPIKKQLLVPFTTDTIQFIQHKYFVVAGKDRCTVYDTLGKAYKVPASAGTVMEMYNNGQLFRTLSAKKGRNWLIDMNGKVVIPDTINFKVKAPDGSEAIGFISEQFDKNTRANISKLYDNQGDVLFTSTNIEFISGTTYLITEVDKNNRMQAQKYLYDAKLKKIVFDIVASSRSDKAISFDGKPKALDLSIPPAPLTRAKDQGRKEDQKSLPVVENQSPFLSVKNAGQIKFYNGSTGKLLATFSDSIIRKTDSKRLRGTISYKSTQFGLGNETEYYYLRENTNEPFTLYDAKINVVNNEYDSFAVRTDVKCNFYLVKKGTKYGMLNRDFQKAIPAEYDQIELHDNCLARVKKNNTWHWVDTLGNTLFNGTDFNSVNGFVVNGKWLALTYKAKPNDKDVQKAQIIDATGKIIATWNTEDGVNFGYMLSANGKILRYPITSNPDGKQKVQLFDPATNKTETLNASFRSLMLYNGNPILIECVNNNQQSGVFSALDLSEVLPFDDYLPSSITASQNQMGKSFKNGVMITAAKKTANPQQNNLIFNGFYSVNGLKFWDKAE